MNKIACLLLFVIVAASCKPSKDLVYQDVQNCKLQKAGLDKTTMCMDIRLYNPNNCTIKLKQADIDVFLNGKLLGQLKVNGKYAVPKLDTFSLPVLMDIDRIDLTNVLTSAFQVLTGSDMTLKITGTIKAGRHGVYIKVPVDFEGKQDVLSSIKL